MNTKQRDTVLQRWQGVIQREARDLVSLEQIGSRAMADSDVRDDPTLQNMIGAELQQRRAELADEAERDSSASVLLTSDADVPSTPGERNSAMSPEQLEEAFNRLCVTLSTALERRDETETRAVLGQMRSLQEQNPEVIPSSDIKEYEQRVENLRIHIQKLSDEIAALAIRAASASRNGKEQDLARSIRRLTAIHAAHPRLLDEPALEDIRRDIAGAAEERRQHLLTIKKLLERERAITAEIKTLAAAVRDFHRIACTTPESNEAFREAEETYLRTIQTVRTYDTEWFSGVVLELADLLAEWVVPPAEAGSQIDRFLDSIEAGLARIRAEMREIESENDSDASNGNA